jgi:hypothetical protein
MSEKDHADHVAALEGRGLLLDACQQHSILLMEPGESVWITKRAVA